MRHSSMAVFDSDTVIPGRILADYNIKDIFKIRFVLNFEHRTADNKRYKIGIQMIFTNI